MGRCGFVQYTFVFACCFFCVHTFEEQDGSQRTSEGCDCDSLESWLPKRKNGDSKLLSYEANIPSYQLVTKDSFKRLRLWLPKHCELLFIDKSKSLRENAQSHRQNLADWSVEVLLDDQLLENCITAKVKCKKRILCVGIDTGKQGAVGFTRRKLLMFRTDDSKDTFTHQPYGVLLSVLFLCSMVVLLALCGKAKRKNSEESVAYNSSSHVVQIVSSGKVKNTPSQSVATDTGRDVHEAKYETIEIKVEGSKDLSTDRNSNNATELCIDDDIGKDCGKTNVDGAVFGKEKINHNGMKRGEEKVADEGQKSKEDLENERGKGLAEMERKKENSDRAKGKRKDDKDKEVHEKKKEREEKRKEKEREKEVKDKERSKDSKSKRSHTSPPERPEPRPVPKMSLSVKASSSTANTSDERKMSRKEKKKSKKHNIDSPPASPPPFTGATKRTSFMHRELPKRPSEELDTDDGNYETVIPQGPPRDPIKLMVPSANPRVSASGDSDVYDSVDDVQVASVSTAGDDTYETVDTKLSKSTASNNEPTAELYESVTGEYEVPRIRKQRSFSDIGPASSTQRTEAEPKLMSLDRKKNREDAPTPPPLGHLKFAKESHEINPYTVTYKIGDHIVQEANIVDEPRPPKNRLEEKVPLSDEELAELYTPVDKEKQKKDREEAEREETTKDGGIEEERDNDGGVVSLSVVGVEEHQYESMPDKNLIHETEDLGLYDEVEIKK